MILLGMWANFKKYLIFIFVIFSSLSFATNNFIYVTKKNTKYAKPEHLKQIQKAYVSFLIKLEDSKIYNQQNIKTSLFSAVHSAYAASNGDFCFFGGYPSSLNPQLRCKKPVNSTCENGGFKCNPQVFGNTCVDVSNSFSNITRRCDQESNLSDDEVRNLINNQDEFLKFQKNVDIFCTKNPSYSGCNTLKRKIKDILETPVTIPSDEELVNQAQDLIEEINKPEETSCRFQDTNISGCPEPLKESLSDVYGSNLFTDFISGTGRALRAISFDGRLFSADSADIAIRSKTPRLFCENQIPENIDIDKLKSDLYQVTPELRTVINSTQGCQAKDLNNLEDNNAQTENNLVEAISQVNLTQRIDRVSRSIDDSLEALYYYDSLSSNKSDTFEQCDQLATGANKERCKKLTQCSNFDSKSLLLQNKEDELQVTIEQIIALEKEKKTASRAQKKLIDDQITEKKKIFPLLNGKEIGKILDNKIRNLSAGLTLTEALQKDVQEARETVKNNITNYQKAYECLASSSSNQECKDIKNIEDDLPADKSDFLNTADATTPELNKLKPFLQCTENAIDRRDQGIDETKDRAIRYGALAASVAAGTVIGPVGGAVKLAQLGIKAARVAAATAVVEGAAEAVVQRDKCTNLFESSVSTTRDDSLNYCEGLNAKFVKKSNLNKCLSDVGTTAVIGGALGIVPFQKLAEVPGVRQIASKVSNTVQNGIVRIQDARKARALQQAGLEITEDTPEAVAKFRQSLVNGELTEDNRYISFVEPSTGERIVGLIEPTTLQQINKNQKVQITFFDDSGNSYSREFAPEVLESVRVSQKSKSKRVQFLNAQRVNGGVDPDLARGLLNDLNLPPAKNFTSANGSDVTISQPFKDRDGRIFNVLEITKNGETTFQTVYRSNSQALFRVLPARNINLSSAGKPGFDKADGEELLTLSSDFQRELSSISIDPQNVKIYDPQELEGILPVNRSVEDYIAYRNSSDYIKPQSPKSKVLTPSPSRPLTDRAGRDFPEPQNIKIEDSNLQPDFSKIKNEYEIDSPVYGKVEARVYRSRNGDVEYTVLKDERNRIWFGDVNDISAGVSSRGTKNAGIAEDLSQPLWEYNRQIPNAFEYAGDTNPVNSSYSDMWKYIKEIPEIQRWYKENGIAVPE